MVIGPTGKTDVQPTILEPRRNSILLKPSPSPPRGSVPACRPLYRRRRRAPRVRLVRLRRSKVSGRKAGTQWSLVRQQGGKRCVKSVSAIDTEWVVIARVKPARRPSRASPDGRIPEPTPSILTTLRTPAPLANCARMRSTTSPLIGRRPSALLRSARARPTFTPTNHGTITTADMHEAVRHENPQNGAGCLWCGRCFTPRVTGGSTQRFCTADHRKAFWNAARLWTMRAVETGLLSVDCLKANQTSVYAARRALRPVEEPRHPR
jgi:hypothetical protein